MQFFGHSFRRSVMVLALVEALVVYAAIFVLATLVVHSTDGPSGFTAAAILPAFLIVLFMIALGFYEPAARADFATATERLSIACLLGAGIGFAVVYLSRTMWVSPLYAIAVASFSYGAVAVTRFALGYVVRAEAFKRRILVLGDGEQATEIRELAALAGPDSSTAGQMSFADAMVENALYSRIIADDVSEIVVADQRSNVPLPSAALLDVRSAGVRITDALEFGERETGKVDLANLYPARFIFSKSRADAAWAQRSKRFLDVVVSSIAVLLLSPLLIATAIAVRIDSKGPAFYRQVRTGLNGTPYEILKFRSMRTDAEVAGKPQWAQANDDRVTRVGRFIRKTRIDELPQLLNILRGEMSLVGPRPERPFFVEQLAEKLPFYEERHRVKPGLTGWAQINYRYGATDEDAREKLRYDLYYVKNRSMFLDILIMMKTVRVVLWPDGVH